MERFDNFGRIAVLFTGAFFISIGIIAFLNLEIQSRSNHGVKIRNENLFEVLGRKISEMIATLKEKNSYRRSLLYHLFIPENTARSSMRKLQHFTKSPSSKDPSKKAEDDFTQTYHRIRHEAKIKKITKLSVKDKNNSVLSNILLDAQREVTPKDDGFRHNLTMVFNDSKTTTGSNGMWNEVLKNSREVHENCYTTNEVLEIIAVTCLVNFIFWFLIILCVNAFTKKQKIWKFNSVESLTSISNGSECELSQPPPKADGNFCTPKRLPRNYVNPLTTINMTSSASTFG